jgi:hypothetical protein
MRYSLVAALGLTAVDEDTDGAGGEPDLITAAQAATLDDLIEANGRDKAKFLDFAGVESLADIRAADYAKAVAMLERKRA